MKTPLSVYVTFDFRAWLWRPCLIKNWLMVRFAWGYVSVTFIRDSIDELTAKGIKEKLDRIERRAKIRQSIQRDI